MESLVTIKRQQSIEREHTKINEFQWPKKERKVTAKTFLVKNVREIKR